MKKIEIFNNFNNVRDCWKRIFSGLEVKYPFLTWEFQSTWWEVFGNEKLEIYVLKENEEIAGIAAFKIIDNNIYWACGEEVSDYLDLICEEQYKDEFWQLLVGQFKKDQRNNLNLRNIPQFSLSRKILKKLSGDISFVQVQEDVVPRLALPNTFESYLQTLSRKARHELRRKIRRFENNQPNNWQLKKSTSSTHDADCKEFFKMFRQNGEEKKSFLTSKMEEFFCKVTAKMQVLGMLDMSMLLVDKNLIAQTISFVDNDTLYLYNMSVNPDFYDLSPGIIINKLLIEESINKKRKVYDFMQGNERYKYQLGAKDEFVYKITIKF